jgi:antitoxin component YwqK of YwqJK toxin-antitoxin module
MSNQINKFDSQGRAQGIWENYMADGTLKGKGHWLHGNPHGLWEWYCNGNPHRKWYILKIK